MEAERLRRWFCSWCGEIFEWPTDAGDPTASGAMPGFAGADPEAVPELF
jgi:hypothetical protein